MSETLIRNGLVVDGTGQAPRKASVVFVMARLLTRIVLARMHS